MINELVSPVSGRLQRAGEETPLTSHRSSLIGEIDRHVYDDQKTIGGNMQTDKIKIFREHLLASSMICAAALFGLSATPAVAQSATNAAVQAPGAGEIQEVVVTGSRIPQPNLTSVSPITVIGSDEIKLEGNTRIEDIVANLPQAFVAQGSGVSNNATGTATVNLRNLGPSRTLVLIDGRRLLPGDPAYPFADLNNIPAALVDRVDVVTGGASAVYGSDAVAGVVNFVMKQNFEGVQLDSQYSLFQHDNGNGAAQSALNARNFPYPSGSVTDGGTTDINVLMGANAPDGKGNVTFYAGYRHTAAVFESNRDYSSCSLKVSAAGGYACSGSGTAATGQFIASGPNSNAVDLTLNTAPPGNTFRPFKSSDQFNFEPQNTYQRPDIRYTAGAFAHYEVNKSFETYAELMFMDDHTDARLAPSGLFGQTFNISCANPMLSAQQIQSLCTNLGYPATASVPLTILKRNVEGDTREDDLRHTAYRMVLGARGQISEGWNYDVYAQQGTTIYADEYLNDFSVRNATNALNVVRNGQGQIVCADPVAVSQGCAPYNIFQAGAVTPAALAYLQTPGFKEGSTSEQVVNASVTGSLAAWGVKSPWAHEGAAVAAGSEYRRESLDLRVDNEFNSGDLANSGATHPVSGGFDVYELFSEFRAPLVQDAPFAKDLSVEAGYRFSSYNTAGTTNTYKFGGEWAIDSDYRLRGGYNRAVRAPNAVELFTPQTVATDFRVDPCAGPTPQYSAAQCAHTGVSAAQYGNILANSAAQYNGLLGGNTQLRPETADTYGVGFVLTPTENFLRGFTFSADYYHIKVTNVIGGVGAQTAIERCATSGDPYFCGLIHRAPGTGSLWLGTNGYVVDTNLNTGSVQTSGVDFESNYHSSLGDWGGLALNLQGTYTVNYAIATLPGDPTFSCVGKYGATCQGSGTPMTAPTPTWRHKVRATWTTPWSGLLLSADWRYYGEVSVDTGAINTLDSKIPAQNYIDLSASVKIYDVVTLHAGVNNVFDRDPPLIGAGDLPGIIGNGNTIPGAYDAMGRYLFVGFTTNF